MRSTLLFVAVLLACTPVHAQAAAPVEAPVLNAWLAVLCPASASEVNRDTAVKRRVPAVRWSRRPLESVASNAGSLLPIKSATLLTHDSNAP